MLLGEDLLLLRCILEVANIIIIGNGLGLQYDIIQVLLIIAAAVHFAGIFVVASINMLVVNCHLRAQALGIEDLQGL